MGTTISIHTFGVGADRIDASQMFGCHRKRVESSLSTHLLGNRSVQRYFEGAGPKSRFDFTIGSRGTCVEAGGAKPQFFDLGDKGNRRLLKNGRRTVQFYQHTGMLPRKPISPRFAAQRERVTRTAVDAMRQAAIPGAKERALVLTTISENTLSLTRDVIRSVPEFGPDHALAHNLAFPAGAIWAGFAVREVKGGYQDYKRAVEIGDKEGKNRAAGRLSTGTLGMFGSGFFLAGKTASTTGAAALAAGTLSLIGDVCFGVGSVVGMGLSSLGIYRCCTFKKRLNEYFENPQLTKEQQVRGSLEFLRDLLVITPEERLDLIQKIDEEHPKASPEEKAELLKKGMADLTEVKVKYLKRRTSNKSLELILTKAEPLLAKLQNPETKEEAIREGEELIRSVKKETNWKMALYTIGLIASIISFVAVIIADVFSLGTIPFIISGVASVIFLMLTAYNFTLQLMKKEPEAVGPQMEPLAAGL